MNRARKVVVHDTWVFAADKNVREFLIIATMPHMRRAEIHDADFVRDLRGERSDFKHCFSSQ